MSKETVFIGYPSEPSTLGNTIEEAAKTLRTHTSARIFETWRQLDIPGRFIIDGILGRIEAAAFVVMDITRLNFNATFEVGYSIGCGKRVFLTLNSALTPQTKEISRLGIFDTLGYQIYVNSKELANHLNRVHSLEPAYFPATTIDRNSPIFVLDTQYKTDATIQTQKCIKKAKINSRVFDPQEIPRLSTIEAYRGVASSVGVIVHLLPQYATDFQFNNLRGALVAGIAMGMKRQLLLLQDGEDPVPLDYRDLVQVYKHPLDVDKHIAWFAPKIMEGLQNFHAGHAKPDEGFLAKLDLGAPAAENEANKLHNYYLPTDSYSRAVSGDVRLAVGRKGSGKTALFLQVADKVASSGRGAVVLDLKPEGYQLKRFKEQVMTALGEAAQEHVAAAFWESVLLLELCHKLLEVDASQHLINHNLFEPYKKLLALYEGESKIGEGDFSERMMRIVERIIRTFTSHNSSGSTPITTQDVAMLVYRHDIPRLLDELADYLRHKSKVWILFDNIDKGWPTHGVGTIDVMLVRSLLEATRKIERSLRKYDCDVHTLVFLRNDVYELLIEQTPDRGKEAKVSLDWTDVDQLKELLRRRFIFNGVDPKASFEETWQRICASHIDGEASSDYLIERSLMRPRNFLNLVTHCKSFAINLQHPQITVDDIRKAERQYSADIGNEIGLEIRDVFPEAADVLYAFISVSPQFTLEQLIERFESIDIPHDRHIALVETLLWFAFLGVVVGPSPEGVVYSYSVYYDMKKLKKLAKDLKSPSVQFAIHRAFWPFLEISR